jgi:hypothetical protein
MGLSKEAYKMLTRYTDPRLTDIAKSVPKDATSIGWMQAVDEARLSTWLDCMGASSLGSTMWTQERKLLSSSLDPPPPSVWRDRNVVSHKADDEELLGS